MKPRAVISWSGGKDSCAALHRTHADFGIAAMVTMFNESAERSRSQGLRPEKGRQCPSLWLLVPFAVGIADVWQRLRKG